MDAPSTKGQGLYLSREKKIRIPSRELTVGSLNGPNKAVQNSSKCFEIRIICDPMVDLVKEDQSFFCAKDTTESRGLEAVVGRTGQVDGRKCVGGSRQLYYSTLALADKKARYQGCREYDPGLFL